MVGALRTNEIVAAIRKLPDARAVFAGRNGVVSVAKLELVCEDVEAGLPELRCDGILVNCLLLPKL